MTDAPYRRRDDGRAARQSNRIGRSVELHSEEATAPQADRCQPTTETHMCSSHWRVRARQSFRGASASETARTPVPFSPISAPASLALLRSRPMRPRPILMRLSGRSASRHPQDREALRGGRRCRGCAPLLPGCRNISKPPSEHRLSGEAFDQLCREAEFDAQDEATSVQASNKRIPRKSSRTMSRLLRYMSRTTIFPGSRNSAGHAPDATRHDRSHLDDWRVFRGGTRRVRHRPWRTALRSV